MDRETGSLNLSDIEAGLERLMPRGLTDSTREDLESVVDGLASASVVTPFWRKSLAWQSAAALLVAALGGAFVLQRGPLAEEAPAWVQVEPLREDSGIAILEQVTWINGGAHLGMEAFNDSGDVSRGWGYVGVEEERILHVSSGYEVILQREFEAEMYAASSL